MRQRGIPPAAVQAALSTNPTLGTTEGTVIYRGGGIEAVVDALSGVIVTLWWS
jgi:hypothetical protein